MWTTDNTVVTVLCTINILFWLVPLGLKMSLSYLIDDLKCHEINQIQIKAHARLRIKLQFACIIICLVLLSLSQIIISSMS